MKSHQKRPKMMTITGRGECRMPDSGETGPAAAEASGPAGAAVVSAYKNDIHTPFKGPRRLAHGLGFHGKRAFPGKSFHFQCFFLSERPTLAYGTHCVKNSAA